MSIRCAIGKSLSAAASVRSGWRAVFRDAIADADVLIDTIDALREENTKLGGAAQGLDNARKLLEEQGMAMESDFGAPEGWEVSGVTPGLSLAFPITDRPQGKPTGYGASCSASVREYTG